MLRATLFAMVLGASAASASDDITFDTLRPHVFGQDHAAVQSLLESAQQRYATGALSADDMRALFIGLSRSHPGIVGFVKDWAQDEPDSAYARIARAWSLWNAADQVGQSRNTYAWDAYYEMKDAAVAHAKAAVRQQPDLVPASDAVLRMYGYDRSIGNPMATLQSIMNDHPNWGSILRVFPLVGPFGEGVFLPFCEMFGEKVSPGVVTQCQMHGTVNFDRKAKDDFATWDGWNPDNPAMVLLRISSLMRSYQPEDLSDDQLDWLEDAMLDFDADLFQLIWLKTRATNYANGAGFLHERYHFFEAFQHAHLARANSFLKDDPYNLALLDLIEGVEFARGQVATDTVGGALFFTLIDDETDEERVARKSAQKAQALDFAQRRLVAAPFDRTRWEALAQKTISVDIARFFDFESAFHNAIVFAEDPVAALDGYLLHKVHQLDFLEQSDTQPYPKAMKEMAAAVDRNRDVLCPFLRAYRLLEGLCTFKEDTTPKAARPMRAFRKRPMRSL